jgi:hypothetical protein
MQLENASLRRQLTREWNCGLVAKVPSGLSIKAPIGPIGALIID